MPEEFAILLFFFGIAATAAVGFAVGWLRAARRVKRLEEGQPVQKPAVADDGRLERLEQIVEGIASQVDQLQASQEFLSRLITTKPGKVWAPELEKGHEVTPH
jgi:hypothetical protein